MTKKFLWTAIVSGVMLCFLYSTNATAARIEATLGWHNLMDDFYLVVEGSESDPLFSDGIKIKNGKLRNSLLADPGGIHTYDLNLDAPFEIWSVDTTRKFDKWIAKMTVRQLKKAAKNQQIDEFGSVKGWKEVFREWKMIWKGQDDDEDIDLWSLYNQNDFIQDSFNMLEGKKINGKIGNIKFTAALDIFANPAGPPEVSNTVPEPATMFLFGVGLIGLAGVCRRKQ